jgi:hypothetical protein
MNDYGNSQYPEQNEIASETVREIAAEIFFGSEPTPTTLIELKQRLGAEAQKRGMAEERVEQEFMIHLWDWIASKFGH